MSTENQVPPPGSFCWVDLNTTDVGAAKTFYGALFGWEGHDVPFGDGASYTMLQLGGRRVAGMNAMPPAMRQAGARPHWLSHVLVKDADEVARRAAALGGKVLMAPFDIMNMGRMAVVQDPTGASVSAWQPIKPGDALYRVPGALCWNELMTTDTAVAGKFYASVFDWDQKEQAFGDMTYTVFENKGQGHGGMLTLPEQARAMGATSTWLVYFAVADCDASVQKATSLGAKVLVPTKAVPTVGRFAVFADPQGAEYAILQPEKRSK